MANRQVRGALAAEDRSYRARLRRWEKAYDAEEQEAKDLRKARRAMIAKGITIDPKAPKSVPRVARATPKPLPPETQRKFDRDANATAKRKKGYAADDKKKAAERKVEAAYEKQKALAAEEKAAEKQRKKLSRKKVRQRVGVSPKGRKKTKAGRAITKQSVPVVPTPTGTKQQRSPLDFCPGCQEVLPIEDWNLSKEEEELPGQQAFVCRACRVNQRQPGSDLLVQLSLEHRAILRDLVTTQNVAETARRNGVTEGAVKKLVEGRGKDGVLIRQAWQEILNLDGLDLPTLSKMARLQLFAMEPKWNPECKQWDFFPDHKGRMRAVQWLTKQHGMEPKASNKDMKGGITFNIQHNLGNDPAPPPPPSKGMGYTMDMGEGRTAVIDVEVEE